MGWTAYGVPTYPWACVTKGRCTYGRMRRMRTYADVCGPLWHPLAPARPDAPRPQSCLSRTRGPVSGRRASSWITLRGANDDDEGAVFNASAGQNAASSSVKTPAGARGRHHHEDRRRARTRPRRPRRSHLARQASCFSGPRGARRTSARGAEETRARVASSTCSWEDAASASRSNASSSSFVGSSRRAWRAFRASRPGRPFGPARDLYGVTLHAIEGPHRDDLRTAPCPSNGLRQDVEADVAERLGRREGAVLARHGVGLGVVQEHLA